MSPATSYDRQMQNTPWRQAIISGSMLTQAACDPGGLRRHKVRLEHSELMQATILVVVFMSWCLQTEDQMEI